MQESLNVHFSHRRVNNYTLQPCKSLEEALVDTLDSLITMELLKTSHTQVHGMITRVLMCGLVGLVFMLYLLLCGMCSTFHVFALTEVKFFL